MLYTTIISADDLVERLHDEQWMIFDCRFNLFDPDEGRNAYLRTHIPGAHYLDLACDLSGKKTGHNGRHPLPNPHEFADELASLGLSNEMQVVVYDQAAHFSPRLWWMLRWIGHEAVAVLDGGFAKWVKDGFPVSEDVPDVNPANYEVKLKNNYVDVDFISAHLNQSSMLLIDARTPERFHGENETIDPIGGHIPGAVSRFFVNNFDGAGHFKSAEVLQQEFSQLLKEIPSQQVVHQCGSGVTACHNILAMEIAGLNGSRLYPGSWSEWCSDSERPIEK